MSDEPALRGLIGVYPDRPSAERIASELGRAGVPERDIRLEHDADRKASLLAEMREETSQGYIAPQVGVAYPKQSAKSLVAILPLFVLAGAVLAFPFSFIPIEDVSFGVRCFWIVLAGAAAGGAIGAIALPALSSKSGLEPNAAQRGVVVRVSCWSQDIEDTMAAAGPIRLDRYGADQYPLGTVTTEEEREPGGVAEGMRDTLSREVHAAPEDRER